MNFNILYFLKNDDQLLITGLTKKRVINGPGIFFVSPFLKVCKRKGVLLKSLEYIKIKNNITGLTKIERGPKLFFLSEYDEIIERLCAITLKHDEYIRIIDNETGKMRIEQGETTVFLSATEQLCNEKKKGIIIDETTAVLIRNIKNGSLMLETNKMIFVPNIDHTILECRHKILLENHETVVIKNNKGDYIFKTGTTDDSSFFLEPYHELVKFIWSSGITKETKNLRITHLDSRFKFMWYEFGARTNDNVELIIGITFFWRIIDVRKMILTTSDTTGDICAYARSVIIQSISKVTLEKFLNNFNNIINISILNFENNFYSDRGVEINSIEVRSISCKNENTENILQEIVQETTNKLNRIQKQESENEVNLKKITGEIESEKKKNDLLDIKELNLKKGAEIIGKSKAVEIKTFFKEFDDEIIFENRLKLFNTIKTQENIKNLSKGNTNLYFTPNDVELCIQSK